MSRIYLIFKFLFDKNIPLKEKWWIIIPLTYIISPIDLIPAPIFGFSIIDDIIMFIFLLSIVMEKTKKYYDKERNNKTVKKDKIVEDVEYEIHKDEEE